MHEVSVNKEIKSYNEFSSQAGVLWCYKLMGGGGGVCWAPKYSLEKPLLSVHFQRYCYLIWTWTM